MSAGVLLFGLVGILALLVLAAMLGLSRQRLLAGVEEVLACARDTVPEARVQETALDADQRAALLLLADGRLLAIRVLGDRLVQRLFAPHSIRALRRIKPKGKGVAVRLVLADWGFPSLRLRFEQAEPPAWMERLRRAATS